MIDDIALNTDNILALDNELNNVKSRLSAVENRLSALESNNKAEIVSAKWVASNTYQIDCKINKTGNYAIILTLYGSNVGGITVNAMPGYTLSSSVKNNNYGNPETMKVVILTPDSIQLSGSTIVPAEYWIAGNTFSIQYDTTVGDIDCVSISTGER